MREFDTVEQALEELKKGKIILVTDDEDRENEGDYLRGRVCNDRKSEFYGNTWKRTDLHADVKGDL